MPPVVTHYESFVINNAAPVASICDQPLLIPEPTPIVESPVLPPAGYVEQSIVGEPVYSPSDGCAATDCVVGHQVGGLGFLRYPYACGQPGVMSFCSTKEWTGSASFEYGSNFERLSRRGFGVQAEYAHVGIDFKWDSYSEDLGGGFTDELHLTDINLMFRLADAEHYLVRAGLGGNILGDAFGTDGGFNLTAKADVFPVEPLVLSGELDLGTVGDAEMFHAAGKVGLMMDRFEIFGGYDYRNFSGIELKGAMVGCQIWF